MMYTLPEKDDQALLQAYIREHDDHHEAGISAGMGLVSMAFDKWVYEMHKNTAVRDDAWGR